MMKIKDIFWVLFISMVPLIELRGAVPVGTVLGLPFYTNFTVAVIGNLLPVPFILLFIPKVLDFMYRFEFFRPIVSWVRKKAYKNSGKIQSATTEAERDEQEVIILDKHGNEITNRKRRSVFFSSGFSAKRDIHGNYIDSRFFGTGTS